MVPVRTLAAACAVAATMTAAPVHAADTTAKTQAMGRQDSRVVARERATRARRSGFDWPERHSPSGTGGAQSPL